MVKESQCSLCGEAIPGVYVKGECWCGRCVSQNPEVFGIEKPKRDKQTESKSIAQKVSLQNT